MKELKELSVHFSSENFDNNELLLRAVYPANRRPDFWENGHLSSAALKDSKGLSVDRTGGRAVSEAVDYIRNHLTGVIVSLTVEDCNEVKAKLCYLPTKKNPFHSEIHGSDTELVLDDMQAFLLSRKAKWEFPPETVISSN
jgi:hypothetical protein